MPCEVIMEIFAIVEKEVLLLPVVKSNPKTVLVKLPDGHVIKRHRAKHLFRGE